MGDVPGDWLMPTLALPPQARADPNNKASPLMSSHWTDELVGGPKRSRRIQNWQNFVGESGLWQASNNHGRDVALAHAGLGYSTQWAWDAGPQQLYVSSLPSQAPQGGMVKAAVAHRPDLWVSSAVVNAVNGVTPTRTNTSVTHVNLMPEGGAKVVDIGPEKYNEKYSYAGMPSEYPRVGYAVPDGCTIELSANGRALRFLTHETGEAVQYMHTQDAYGWWGAPEVSMLMPNTGGVELVPQGTQLILGKTYHIFDLVPVAAEWSASFGQVHIDPNVTLSGAPDYEDNTTRNAGGKSLTNYGATAGALITTLVGGTVDRTNIWRVLQSALPGGSTIAASWNGSMPATGFATGLYRIKDGNASWVVGTADGAKQVGSSCFAQRTNPSPAWLGGSTGASSLSDRDAIADGSRTSTAAGYNSWTILPETIDSWLLLSPNAGMVLLMVTHNATISFESAESTNQPFVDIEYAEPTTGLFRRGIGRGIGRGIMRGM